MKIEIVTSIFSNHKSIEKINETANWFFEKVNKIDKPLTRLIKKKRERAQINTLRSEKGSYT